MNIAVDFDGTLVEEADWPAFGPPKLDIVEKVKQLKAQGHTLILWTCRTDKPLINALEYCSQVLGIDFDYVNQSTPEEIEKYKNNPRKISADYYIDDRALSPKEFLERFDRLEEENH